MHFLLYTFKCFIRFQVIIVSNFLSQIMSYDVTQENKMQKPESNMGGKTDLSNPRASEGSDPCKILFLAFTIQNVHAIRKNVKIAGNVAMLWPRLTSMVMMSAKFGLRRFPRLVCLLTLNRAKKCACRLSNTSVQDKEI